VKHVSWILTLPLTVAVIVFAVANRHFVPLDLWPFEIAMELPVFVLVLGSVFVGFVIGALAMWLSAGKQRRRARAVRSQLGKLEREARRQQEVQDRPAARSGVPAPVPMVTPPRPAKDPGESGRPAA
jgi:uncharacterized integral membrane protein